MLAEKGVSIPKFLKGQKRRKKISCLSSSKKGFWKVEVPARLLC
jgi:hypothetical protein